ncbi:hypothetical protein ABVK25_011860 [Lepraria finkii]|uniref:Uncharacterized protein n=1 Tax=Lepraria finkii TaxID=1340010 RepID=A0ABR4ALU6_9LECA
MRLYEYMAYDFQWLTATMQHLWALTEGSSNPNCVFATILELFPVSTHAPSGAEPSGYCRNSFLSIKDVLNGALADEMPSRTEGTSSSHDCSTVLRDRVEAVQENASNMDGCLPFPCPL